jgi:hypothetical protein
MTKKIIALCALLSINSFVGANGYPAGQGYEAPKNHHDHHGHHGHHNRDKITDEADEDRLKALKELDESAAFWRNASRAGMGIGAIFAGVNALGVKDKNITHIAGGVFVFALSAGGNLLVNGAEEARAKERKEILERRAKNNHHR